ncbi:heterokaryon incompatibility protein-domain-containing protein [Whalleya microplaca]|nr:heterokaryon incompatibility protein-domain-containing protein [Whalleya microplaca]
MGELTTSQSAPETVGGDGGSTASVPSGGIPTIFDNYIPEPGSRLIIETSLCANCSSLVASLFSGGQAEGIPPNAMEQSETLDESAASCSLCAFLASKLRNMCAIADPPLLCKVQFVVRDIDATTRSYLAKLRPCGMGGSVDLRSFRHIWAGTRAKSVVNTVGKSSTVLNRAEKNVKLFNSAVVAVPDDYPLSEDAINRARAWLFDCRHNHPDCAAVRAESRLPKRILDLQGDMVSLYVSTGSETGEYATLSYCWGSSGSRLETTSANFQDHRSGIPLGAFPETLRDAICFVKAVGIRFLWIDALCIIQDGDGGKDWAEQAAAMTTIYQGGILNVSALHGEDCTSGLKPKKLSDVCLRVGTALSLEAKQNIYFINPVYSSMSTEGRSLSKRGWAFQERLVSPATLHHTPCGMIWECGSRAETETVWQSYNFGGSRLSPKGYLSKKQQWIGTMRSLVDKERPAGRELQNSEELDVWYTVVGDYSSKKLTFEQDRLPALAGIAARLATALGVTYIAGLWKEDLPRGLCWRQKDPHPRNGEGPTWSWVSAGGRTEFDIASRHADSTIKLLEADMDEVYPGMFGQVRSGKLSIEGTIRKVVMQDYDEHSEDEEDPDDAPLVVYYLDEVDLELKRSLDCWLLHVMNLGDTSTFLALEELEGGVVDSQDKTYRRVGLVKYTPHLGTTGTFVSWQRATLIIV